jgi:hypothetical protein
LAADALVTLTLIVQLATPLFMATPAPPMVTVPLPAVAVMNAGLLVTVLPSGQVVVAAGVAAMTTPLGRASENAIAV